MKKTNHREGIKSAFLKETGLSIINLFFGNITSKIGWALISMLIGILLLIRPIVNSDELEEKKSFIPYLIGSTLIIFSISLAINWKKRNQNCKPTKHGRAKK